MEGPDFRRERSCDTAAQAAPTRDHYSLPSTVQSPKGILPPQPVYQDKDVDGTEGTPQDQSLQALLEVQSAPKSLYRAAAKPASPKSDKSGHRTGDWVLTRKLPRGSSLEAGGQGPTK